VIILKKKKIFFCLFIFFAIFIILGVDNRLIIKKYNVNSNKVKQKIKLVFIADLHNCKYGTKQEELINEINEIKPDVILFGGDIVDDKIPDTNTRFLLEGLKNYPSYYVTGNHEYWSENVDYIKKMFKSFGVKVLEGECSKVLIKNQAIEIAGIDDFEAGRENVFSQISKANNQSTKELYTVFLSHRPEYIKKYLDYNFDLILSGHAHGGQWRLPGIINGLYAPGQGMFPKYAGGKYNFESKVFIVSRGLARESTRIPRFFNRPELVVINILPK